MAENETATSGNSQPRAINNTIMIGRLVLEKQTANRSNPFVRRHAGDSLFDVIRCQDDVGIY